MSKWKDFWGEKEFTRGWLVVGFVLTCLISTVISYGLQSVTRKDDHRVLNAQLFLDSMAQFNAYSAAFANEVMDKGQATAETRTNLIKNLNDQFARIRNLEKTSDLASLPSLKAYKQEIVNLNTLIEKTNSENLGAYWTQVSRLLSKRYDLSAELQSTI